MRTARDENIETPITSMIDIVFLLIIFFVITSTIQKEVIDTSIVLAKSYNIKPFELPPNKVTINLKKSTFGAASMSIGGFDCTPARLEVILRNLHNQFGAEVPIIIRADGDMLYQEVDKVMQVVGRSGLYKVSIASLDLGKHN